MAKKATKPVCMPRPARELYPQRRFDGKLYKFYVSRAHKFDVDRDKGALAMYGYSARVLTLPYKGPAIARYIVFRRKK